MNRCFGIGDLVTDHSLITDWLRHPLILVHKERYLRLVSLTHLIRVMRKHDLTNTWKIFDKFVNIGPSLTIDNIGPFLTILTILIFLKNLTVWQFLTFWQILTILTNIDNLDKYANCWQFWQFLKIWQTWRLVTFETLIIIMERCNKKKQKKN